MRAGLPPAAWAIVAGNTVTVSGHVDRLVLTLPMLLPDAEVTEIVVAGGRYVETSPWATAARVVGKEGFATLARMRAAVAGLASARGAADIVAFPGRGGGGGEAP